MKSKFYITKIIVLLFFAPTIVLAQAEKNHWFFGQNAYLDFSTNPPTVSTGNLNTGEGCATVATSSGDLLFYTDGIFVYDKNGNQMPNGSGLRGDPSSTHSGLVIPNPCNSDLFYIFTTAAIGQDGMYVYTVDLSLNGGLGDVLANSETLLLIDSTEKLAAVRHNNNLDYWITTTREIDGVVDIYTWLIDANGVSATPIISNTGHPNGTNPAGTNGVVGNYPGQIKFSPDGTLLVAAQLYYDREVDFFNFDDSTGLVTSYSGSIPVSGGPYGIEFSPSGNYLYVTSYFLKQLYQYDISAFPIIGSPNFIGSINGDRGGALQISPDGQKIYVSQTNRNSIGAISNIENPSAIHTNNAIILAPGTQSKLGIPTFLSGNYTTDSPGFQPHYSAVPTLLTSAQEAILADDPSLFTDKELGDHDNDGDIDIYYLDGTVPQIYYFENIAGMGNPPVYSASPSSFNLVNAESYRLYDWDGDGWQDWILKGENLGTNNLGIFVHLNNGNGTFNNIPDFEIISANDFPFNFTRFIEVGDLNQDGNPDILLTVNINGSNGTYYFENDGNNTCFLVAPQNWDGSTITNPFIPFADLGSSHYPTLYDADFDGDEDIIMSDPIYDGTFNSGGRFYFHENMVSGTTTNVLPDFDTVGVDNPFGLNDLPNNTDYACDWIITRIEDLFGNGCPVAVSYNWCNQRVYLKEQVCDTCNDILSVTDTKLPFLGDEIIVFPNPSLNKIFIDGLNSANFHYQIISVNGSILLENSGKSGEAIDVSVLASGLYFIHIETEDSKTTVKRFIKQ